MIYRLVHCAGLSSKRVILCGRGHRPYAPKRAYRVFLVRPLMIHGEDASEAPRRLVDEIERLGTERAAEADCGDLDPPN